MRTGLRCAEWKAQTSFMNKLSRKTSSYFHFSPTQRQKVFVLLLRSIRIQLVCYPNNCKSVQPKTTLTTYQCDVCDAKLQITGCIPGKQWKLQQKQNTFFHFATNKITYPINSSSRLFRLTPAVVFARISTKICGNFSTMQIKSVEKFATCNKVSDCIFVYDRCKKEKKIYYFLVSCSFDVTCHTVVLDNTSVRDFQHKLRTFFLGCQAAFKNNLR